jgi:polyferredoxin
MNTAATLHEPRRIRLARRSVQAFFVLINLVLIDVRLPGVMWVIIGGVFWATVIIITLTNGPIICSWVCWLGAAQDWAEPLAKRRVMLNPTFWRTLTLIVAVLWAPFTWLIRPDVISSTVMPFGLSYTNLHAHFLQVGFFMVAALSVMLLGKRGACICFCPLLFVSRVVRSAARLQGTLKAFRLKTIFGKRIVINTSPPR